MSERILVSVRDGIAEVRLLAAVDAVLLRELGNVVSGLGGDASVRVVVLVPLPQPPFLKVEGAMRPAGASAGGAGADDGGAGDPGGASALDETGGVALRGLELMPQPVIVAIEGDAIGAALELVLACDVRIASEDATFGWTGVAEGAMPSLGGTQRLPRLAGRAVAAQMLLLGETVDAATALRCGLVSAVLPRREVRAHAERLAASMAARGPLALRYAKEAMLRGLDMPLEQALRFETDLTVILQTTDERAEGVRAFLEKRPPAFGSG